MEPRVYHFIAYNRSNGESKEIRVVYPVKYYDAAVYEGNIGEIYEDTKYSKYKTLADVAKNALEYNYPSIPWDVRKVARNTKPFSPSMYLDLVKDGAI